MRRYCFSILISVALLQSGSLHAAEPTDVLDAADGEDPYDFNLEISFDHQEDWGQIQREYPCTNQRGAGQEPYGPSDIGYDPNCATRDRVVSAREMEYRRTANIMKFLARFGIYHDLEFRFTMPYVIGDQTRLDLAGTGGDPNAKPIKASCSSGENCSPSSIYRVLPDGSPDLVNSLFTLPNRGPERNGIGDLQFGLRWTPWNAERDDTVATWLIGVDYQAPTAEAMQAGNTAVGRKLHELTFLTRMSRRFSRMDPYVGFDFTLVLNSEKSLFQDLGDGQTLVSPGHRFGIEFGTEIVPWENQQKHQKFSIDFGGRFGYQFEGRDYSPLFDALGTSTCSRDYREWAALSTEEQEQRIPCQMTQEKDIYRDGKSQRPDPDAQFYRLSNGLVDVDQFGQVWGWFGLNVQAAQYIKFRGQVNVSHQFDHFLTNADSGKDSTLASPDTDPPYRVGFIDPNTPEENPVFNESIDTVGRRLRLAEHINLSAFFMLALTF